MSKKTKSKAKKTAKVSMGSRAGEHKPAKTKKKVKKKEVTSKVTQPKTQQKSPRNPIERLKKFLEGVIREAKQIIWPSRDEVINASIAVILITAFLSLYMFVVDLLSGIALEYIGKLLSRGL